MAPKIDQPAREKHGFSATSTQSERLFASIDRERPERFLIPPTEGREVFSSGMRGFAAAVIGEHTEEVIPLDQESIHRGSLIFQYPNSGLIIARRLYEITVGLGLPSQLLFVEAALDNGRSQGGGYLMPTVQAIESILLENPHGTSYEISTCSVEELFYRAMVQFQRPVPDSRKGRKLDRKALWEAKDVMSLASVLSSSETIESIDVGVSSEMVERIRELNLRVKRGEITANELLSTIKLFEDQDGLFVNSGIVEALVLAMNKESLDLKELSEIPVFSVVKS